ncbi:hypothetical protein QYF36_001056 [Acer negundo]|nr:hypothetical protein QYF36_001056 [Acer negundo]
MGSFLPVPGVVVCAVLVEANFTGPYNDIDSCYATSLLWLLQTFRVPRLHCSKDRRREGVVLMEGIGGI